MVLFLDGLAVTSIDYRKEPTLERPNRIIFHEDSPGNEAIAFENDAGRLEEHNDMHEDAATFMSNIKHIGGADEDGKRVFEADALTIQEAFDFFEEKHKGAKPLFVVHGFTTEAGSTINECINKQPKFDEKRSEPKEKIILVPVIWPTYGDFFGYKYDRDNNAPEAVDEFNKMLDQTYACMNIFQTKSLLCHSMGNQIFRSVANSKIQFDNIFLVAADIRYDIFEKQYIDKNPENDYAINMFSMITNKGECGENPEKGKRGKIYCLYNKWDYALDASDSFLVNGVYRLGQYGIQKQKLHPDIDGDFIENFDAGKAFSWTNFMAHAYQFDDFAIQLYCEKM